MRFDEQPRLTDPRAIRAMAHPLRLKLLELLAVHPTLTATQASELTDESPANCSFHLRTMAKYGFVTDAEGGTGRQRPWKATHGINIRTEDLDAAGQAADRALVGVARELGRQRLEAWDRGREAYPKPWRQAAFESHLMLVLTAEELNELGERFLALAEPYLDRMEKAENRPAGALPVNVVLSGVPTQPEEV